MLQFNKTIQTTCNSVEEVAVAPGACCCCSCCCCVSTSVNGNASSSMSALGNSGN